MGHKPFMLRRQYRCHPALADIPNRLFYDGRLLNGCSAEERPPLVEGWPPISFCDVRGTARRAQGGGSSANGQEAECVLQILRRLGEAGVEAAACGVICFFRAQVALIQDLLAKSSGGHQPEAGQHSGFDIQVATVDSFQGMEKDVIILTTSVTSPGPFCSDNRRLNVALTRARHHLVLVGHVPALRQTSRVFSEVLEAGKPLRLREHHSH
ncbi:unnamed protein product [Ostreobium quekettii]|uniref:DNA2/NAM7 helicase-like C-terminal domain-containing protein n=1 Tax=Ostreobium quekettii TaxID=121088 RepID=A0A8S1J8M3_9CHLO|nr:unnamed protein product [Ostreobium quekettii]